MLQHPVESLPIRVQIIINSKVEDYIWDEMFNTFGQMMVSNEDYKIYAVTSIPHEALHTFSIFTKSFTQDFSHSHVGRGFASLMPLNLWKNLYSLMDALTLALYRNLAVVQTSTYNSIN